MVAPPPANRSLGGWPGLSRGPARASRPGVAWTWQGLPPATFESAASLWPGKGVLPISGMGRDWPCRAIRLPASQRPPRGTEAGAAGRPLTDRGAESGDGPRNPRHRQWVTRAPSTCTSNRPVRPAAVSSIACTRRQRRPLAPDMGAGARSHEGVTKGFRECAAEVAACHRRLLKAGHPGRGGAVTGFGASLAFRSRRCR